jgi:hypothetical protein
LVSCSNAANAVVQKMNTLGAGPPERLFNLSGVTVVHAALARSPWRREVPAIAPNRRHVFQELLDNSWAVNVRRRIAELDGAESKTAAAQAA